MKPSLSNTSSRGSASRSKTRSRNRPDKQRPVVARKSRLNRLEVIASDQAEHIIDAVFNVLATVGMIVEDAEARAMLISAGCQNKDDRILYPRDVVRRALETVPPKIDFLIRMGNIVFPQMIPCPDLAVP